jgi:cell division transport system permease protein
VREDLEWIRRLDALLEVLRRVMVVTAVLLVAAMLLVVGNAVRLEIAGRRDEIIVSKLIGATDAFIRRPFVYRGLWIGLAGGAVALTLVALLLAGLGGATRQLSQLYGADFALQGPSLAAVGGILLGAGLLGAASAWLAATWHLRRVEPN